MIRFSVLIGTLWCIWMGIAPAVASADQVDDAHRYAISVKTLNESWQVDLEARDRPAIEIVREICERLGIEMQPTEQSWRSAGKNGRVRNWTLILGPVQARLDCSAGSTVVS